MILLPRGTSSNNRKGEKEIDKPNNYIYFAVGKST